ncbi:MAG: hypothetical protein Kow00129_08750 [Thermoleophilia bacterium]
MYRRFGYLLLALLLALSLGVAAGCGEDEPAAEEEDLLEEETTTTEATDMTEGEAGEVNGADVFATNCASCHGAEGEGGNSPALTGLGLSPEDIEAQVRQGGGGMPAFEGILSDAEIEAVVGYVASELN